ncbi:MAG: hemolysin family protein [Armatimonadota bacterium]|nr:hemolysin family protein [Armatimonadota bacterium]MDR7427082.1 hemolysin family protein [Armatimonadota bacterium]MDR7464903.1 hemolysin family protein [Armatimonadota bacterium]MDR7471125.1 hemolysin family protein [Armatimonadota bacterium]MDR7474150.1 hemolysin family protein [Armatimonadota bacterium]
MELSVTSIMWRLVAVLVLVAANGMFVAAEFSIVAVRRTRLLPLVESGSPRARMVLRATDNLDPYLAATQLGITMASLGLGWIGEPAVAALLEPLLHPLPLGLQEATTRVVAIVLAFALITTLHIVFGELAAKSLAIWRPEATALVVTPPTELFSRLFRPFIWVLNGAANATLSLFGLRAPSGRHVYSPEEIRLLVSESRRAGVVEEEEALLVHRVFKFADRLVEEVMVPRVSVRGVPNSAAVVEAVAAVREAGFTRLPVFSEDLDHIVGMVHAKDLLVAQAEGREGEPVDRVMRPVLYVPEMKPVVDLLEEMRRQGIQLAVVLDEFGGTSGIVTIEDLLEELVGEIPGEFRPERRLVVLQQPDRIVVDAAIPLDELNERFHIALPTTAANTLGGFIFHHLEAIPEAGTTFRYQGLEFRIESATRTRIGLVQIRRVRP